jgi:predicted nucleotide-binding protein
MESAVDLLTRLIAEAERFTFENFCYPNMSGTQYAGDDSPQWLAWKTRAANLVQQLMSPDCPASKLLKSGLGIRTDGNYRDKFEKGKATILKALELTRDTVTEDVYGELLTAPSTATSPALSNRVFVVHGHDHALKTDVERFLRELNLEPVVLHRQPDRGMTLIEKFEEYSDVGYAFVLLTPDEVAYPAESETLPEGDRPREKRARPNVIFEFGFFVAKLGRERVCCLYKTGVVLPSDLTGLVYKEISDTIDPQAYSIIKELKAAGYNINL